MVSSSPQEGFEWLAGHEALDVAYKKISLVRNVIGKPKRSYLKIATLQNGRFYTKDALSVWTNLGKDFLVRLGYASLV